MAIYQPTNILPSSFAGEGGGVVAAADAMYVSWQINGNSALTAFRIDIYENTTASTLVYSTGKISDGCPASGTDARGNTVPFVYAPEGVTWGSLGLSDGGDYKLKITQYYAGGSVAQYSDSVFITRSAANVTIVPFSVPVASAVQNVTATYYQAQGDAINWVRWQFYSVSDGVLTLIDDTGRINTGVLAYTCDGLLDGNEYAIVCSVGTASGYIATSETVTFAVSYERRNAPGKIYIGCAQTDAPIIRVGEGDVISAKCDTEGGYTVSGGEITVNAGAEVYWDEVSGSDMDFAAPWTLKWSGDFSGDGNIISLSGGNMAISKSGASLVVSSDMQALTSIYIPNGAQGAEITVSGSGVWVVFSNGATAQRAVSYTQQRIFEVRLFAGVSSGISITDADGKKIFDATFEENADAGSVSSGTGYVIYKSVDGESVAQKIYEVPAGQTAIKDYGNVNGESFVYEAMEMGSDGSLSEPSVSEQMCARYRSYWLMEAKEDATQAGVYHVLQTFEFEGNIAEGAMTNNNSPTMQTNFTPYRLRQPTSVSGISGTLTALIGTVENGEYVGDTAAKMKAIYALSTSPNVLFLKDMKGNLRMVHTSAPITQTINIKDSLQSVTVNLPWEEIGDAEGVSLILTQNDALWGDDVAPNDILSASLDINVESGMLYATYPDSYYGTTFGLYGGELTANTPDNTEAATIEYEAPFVYASI